MGKRSDFERIDRDCYDTPIEAVLPLLPFLAPQTVFIEPCAGAGVLMHHLETVGDHIPVHVSDIEPRADWIRRQDMLDITKADLWGATHCITNPPWGRKLLHALILHMRQLNLPAWLLIDANWAFTQQAVPFLNYCERIVTIGRVIWIPGTTMTGKDDCAWFLFAPREVLVTEFHGQQEKHTQVLSQGVGAPARAAARS